MILYQDTAFQNYGESIISFGLYVRDGISGIGLVSRGFIYDTYAIYIDTTAAAPITTTWAVGSSVSSTSWNEVSQGYWGDSNP